MELEPEEAGPAEPEEQDFDPGDDDFDPGEVLGDFDYEDLEDDDGYGDEDDDLMGDAL